MAVVRANRLHTRVREQLMYGAGAVPRTMYRIGNMNAEDDADHALNHCTNREVGNRNLKLRHGNVVHKVRQAVEKGSQGADHLWSDAEGRVRPQRPGQAAGRRPRQPARRLPQWVLPRAQQTSIPDVLKCTVQIGQPPPRQYRIDIIEVKVYLDTTFSHKSR